MNHKGFKNTILIVVIIVLVGTVGYFAFIKKSRPIAQQSMPTPTAPKDFKIEVVAPRKNEILAAGQTYQIRWNAFLPDDARLKISLQKGEGGLPIAEDLKNTASYDWIIPTTMSPGFYYISVAYPDEKGIFLTYDESDDEFVITNTEFQTEFIYPTNLCDQKFEFGKTNRIIWNANINDTKADFYLYYQGGDSLFKIAKVAGSLRYYDWYISPDLVRGGSYTLLLTRSDDLKVETSSGKHNVVAKGGFFVGRTDCYQPETEGYQ